MLAKIKDLFTPKHIIFDDIFEKSKYIISYRLTLYLTFALLLLSSVLYVFFELPHAILTLCGFAISLIAFIYIRKTGTYRKFILIFNLLGAFLCIFTLYYVTDQPRIIDGFWMMISCSFTFLTLGKKWGTFVTLANVAAISVFYFFFYNEQIQLIKYLNQSQIFAFCVNIIICFSIMYYFNWQSLKTNKEAENELKNAKDYLENQFDLINKQNNEKTILLKEVHHRVKNNLQVIVSLLRLQSKDITNKNELSKFTESINRVISMSMIHEKIYQSEELSAVNIEDYLKSLAENLIHSYQVEHQIRLVIRSKVESLGLKPIVPLALLFNELCSNSLKYAFDGIESPEIHASLNQLDENKFEFIYADNGKWKTPENGHSFGVDLIEALTEQLDGTFTVEKDNGTKYHFNFENINS